MTNSIDAIIPQYWSQDVLDNLEQRLRQYDAIARSNSTVDDLGNRRYSGTWTSNTSDPGVRIGPFNAHFRTTIRATHSINEIERPLNLEVVDKMKKKRNKIKLTKTVEL